MKGPLGRYARELRATLAGAALVGVLGLGLTIHGASNLKNEHDRRAQTVADSMASQARVVRLQSDLDAVQRLWPRFERMLEDRIVGRLPKTVTLDRFEQVVRDSGVPLLGYALNGRVPLEIPGIGGFERYEPARHELVFETAPLHEEELVGLTAMLDRSLDGLHALEGCELTRDLAADIDAPHLAGVPRLKAVCTIQWYVFAERAPAPSPGM